MASAESHGKYPPDFLRELRTRTDIVALIGEKVALRSSGREMVGLCPFHEEKTPSFYVSADKQVYHCHGCHAGGDAIDFLVGTQGLSFAEAVADLAQRANIQVPSQRPLTAAELHRRSEQEEARAALEAGASFFRDTLVQPVGAEAIAYLRTRGVDGPTAERFGLGYAPPGWEALAQALGRRFPPERLFQVGLLKRREGGAGGYDFFRRRLMFPIWDERGRVIGFGGRAIDPADKAKYLNSPETPLFHKKQALYALHLARAAIRKRERVVVVEGYMDALTCHQFGFEEVVASLGTALSDEQAGMLARLAESAILAYDADPAGDEATHRGLGILEGAGARVAIAELPEGKDPDDLLRTQGPEALGTSLRDAKPLIRYLVHKVLTAANLATLSPGERWNAAMRIAPFLARLPAGVRREAIEWVARQLLVAEPVELERAVNRLADPGREHRNRSGWNASWAREDRRPVVRSGADAAEETVLAACLQSERRLHGFVAKLSIHDFRNPAHKALVQDLLAMAAESKERSGDEVPGQALLDRVEDVQVRARIGRLLAADLSAFDDAALGQCMAKVQRTSLQEERLALRAEDRRLEAQGHGIDSGQRRAVLRRISELTAELSGFARGGSDE